MVRLAMRRRTNRPSVDRRMAVSLYRLLAALLRMPAGSDFRSLERGAIAAGVEEVGRIGTEKSAYGKCDSPGGRLAGNYFAPQLGFWELPV
jgi:hypothetical protein